ncbi:ADP-glyceromanno-heptose 6-epimerase [Aureispira anguillae]|uniref:ADP-glyceromanno-heptose 6-epimerase n=1 Tax=Aureispira anguillae TaxID=2864201 RepID=A0A915YHS4_9BACT|nr:ADP-glyceromanno-heptose 6-epimerase [Aureispira anguillae]BDS13427.1 ADP-glyceromanno-heptose 6-epimerase [Aureispira anguillae]
MIVITGAAGFIGSCSVSHFNQQGIEELIVVDQFDRADKQKNLAHCRYFQAIDRANFIPWLEQNAATVSLILHLGARTDTTEKEVAIFDELNLNYTKAICKICTTHQIPLIYASSGATYGLGEQGYDDATHPSLLKPLNPYGNSKNDFDQWLLAQDKQPPFWAGLKFFNVYGPNEYHKGRMASVIFHTFHQINKTNGMKLFRSHRPGIKDGEQSRDFVYVKDLLSIIDFLIEKRPASGLYNVGTGTARTFYDLAKYTFEAMNKVPHIGFIDTPEDIRDTYQYFTEAKMAKLRAAGYQKDFYSLEEGVKDYVQNYLMTANHY